MSWHHIIAKVDTYKFNGHCFHLVCISKTLNQPKIWKYECCRCSESHIVLSLLKDAQSTLSSMSSCLKDRPEPPKEWEDDDFIYRVSGEQVDQQWKIEGLYSHIVGMSIEDVSDDHGLTIYLSSGSTLVINSDGVYLNGIEFVV